ncbi:MAG: D-alanyl-D-alanine carboxypeptidase family protein [Elainellaceae cyanobacterium]
MVDPSPNSPSNKLFDDIPEAKRETPSPSSTASKAKGSPSWFWIVGATVAALLAGIGAAIAWRGLPAPIVTQPVASAEPGLQDALAEVGISVDSDTGTLLGHKPYEEAPADTLVSVTADGGITLRRPAANAFIDMVNAARNDGVYIVPLSGFRSVEQQQYLFFGIKEEQAQRASERATVSAPPGYSEHHTGYAMDVGDADAPKTHLEQSFENTKAFRWLQENAARYSFELSFEKDESSEVSYEPWQWRYVGDRESLETFYGSQ